jgi:hypothetical protein
MKARIIYPDDEKDWLKITSAKIIPSKNQKLSKINSINILKIKSIVAVSVIATITVAAIFGYQLTEIIAEEIQAPEYLTAEGVTITGVFKFKEGEELVTMQQFTQLKGFKRAEPFIFTVQKVVGNTPLLHKYADEAFIYRNSESQKQDINSFNVEVILATGPDAKRVFSYSDCFVDDYTVRTLTDNEEGYFNKGFAVVENYNIECKGLENHNPALDEMTTTKQIKKANTTSSMDLKEPFPTWNENFKYKKSDSQQ